jgi:ketosteroid isomerase-like protein
VDFEHHLEVGAELEAAHARAKQAYRTKDLESYMDGFTPDLAYKQLDGRVIGRDELRRQVQAQFAAVQDMDGTYSRESLEAAGGDISEVLTQMAWARMRFLGVFRRTWRVERRGRYVWSNSGGVWRIRSVEVLSERTR